MPLSLYDQMRNRNIRELGEMYFLAFGKPMPNSILLNRLSSDGADLPSPPPQPVRRRRRRSSTSGVNRKPVRRSTRICRSKYASIRRERGFIGFPLCVFLRWTKYRGRRVTVSRVTDDVTDVPEPTDNLEFTFCTIVEVPLDLIPAECLTPEMSGNGWKDGVELGSDDEVEINWEEDIASNQDCSNEAGPSCSRRDSNEAGPSCSNPRGPSDRANPTPILKVEDVTQDLLNKICYTSKKSRVGDCSTCHQCRQKTSDTKSICRSGRCRGLRGMFCGNCLLHRYGEDVAVVLKDPNWECPPCRNLCNCSICRSRAKKAPTGALFPVVVRQGYECVSDYLKDVEDD